MSRVRVASWLEEAWYGRRPLPPTLGPLLGALAWAWEAVVAHRGRKALPSPLPTVAVSSPAVGGSGKTPLARWFATHLQKAGHRVALVSRGHGGRLRGPVRVDPSHTAADVGDEPLCLARQLGEIPVIVGRDRLAGIAMAKDLGATVVVLDDASMVRSVRPQWEVMVLGTAGWIGNGKYLPAGPLRLPPESIGRAQALVAVTEPGGEPLETLAGSVPSGVLLVPATVSPAGIESPDGVRHEPGWVRHRPVCAWAGIARPWRFRRMLLDMGVDMRGFVVFPDHHVYSPREVERLARLADGLDALPLTTAKDRARWPSGARWTPYVVDVVLSIEDPAARRLLSLVEEALHG